MTQPKKPEKSTKPKGEANTPFSYGEYRGFNSCYKEMEAYYQPIIEELVEALDYLNKMSINVYNGTNNGTYSFSQAIDGAIEALAKYKAIK